MKRRMFLSVATVLMIVASIVGVRVDAGDKPFTSPATLTSAFRGQDHPVIQSSDIGFRLVRDF